MATVRSKLNLESIKLDYLVTRYINENFINISKNYDHFASPLINEIIKFLGNIFIIFDVYHEHYRDCILNNGQTFKRNNTNTDSVGYISIGCSITWISGVHEWKIKIKQYASFIGIVSDLTPCKQKEKFIYEMTKGYSYYIYCGKPHSLIWSNQSNSYVEYSLKQIKPNDIVTVKLNCNEWKLQFYVNNEKIGKMVPIKKDNVYYPVICSKNKDDEYYIID
eukprot:188256_1